MNRTPSPRSERGQSLVEIVLILALVVVGTIGVLIAYGVSVRDVYCQAVGLFGIESATCQVQTAWSDGFDDLSMWKITQGKKWNVQNGQLCVGPGGEHRGFTGDSNWTDYTVNFDQTELNRGSGYGVYIRATNEPNINAYAFQYDPGYGRPNGAFIFRKIVNGQELSPPIAVSPAPAGYNWYDVSRNVSVQVKGDTYTAYVDGQPVVTAHDGSYKTGRVGLRTWDGAEACFDNLSITQP